MIRFAALGSGSRGNGWVVEAGDTRVLVDCGFPLRETIRRLARLGLSPEDLAGVLVTHEHGDHAGGVGRLARKFALPVWLTHGTHAAIRDPLLVDLECRFIDGQQPLDLTDLQVHPFSVPHDAREPVQFVFAAGQVRLGIMTDVGSLTVHMLDCLAPCDALVLETNHDAALLRASRYHESLKNRIAGRFGHLENELAADLLVQISKRRGGLGHLQHLVAAHLSEENNRPDIARAALQRVAGAAAARIELANQSEGLPWRLVA